MFSLIIAIVSVALVVALVALSSYYGGSSVSDAQSVAEAARLKNEEQQILGSVEMFNADHGRWPDDIQELVSAGYLTSIPQGVYAQAEEPRTVSFISSAFAADVQIGWETPVKGQPVYTTIAKVPQLTCRKYNQASRLDDGILKQVYASLRAQCFGEEGTYKVVISRGTASDIALTGAAGGSGVVSGGLPPEQAGDSWWDTPPSSEVKGDVDPDKGPRAVLALGSSTEGFGALQVGQEQVSSARTLLNSGNATATAISVSAPAGFDIIDSTCAGSLAAGDGCSFKVIFKPTAAQAYGGLVKVASANGGAPSFSVSGSGVQAVASLSGINFGDLPAGSTQVKDAVITNTGIGPVSLGSPQVSGAGFALAAGGTCGASLAAGSSCTVKVSLTGSGVSAHAGNLTVDSANAASMSSSLSGQSQQAILGVSPTSRAFGAVQVGKSSTSADAHTVTNTGNTAATGLRITPPAGYSLNSSTCSSTLAANTSCTFKVTFSPTAVAPFNTSLPVQADNAQAQVNVALSGTGTPAGYAVGQFAVSAYTMYGAGQDGRRFYAVSVVNNTGENLNITQIVGTMIPYYKDGQLGAWAPGAAKDIVVWQNETEAVYLGNGQVLSVFGTGGLAISAL